MSVDLYLGTYTGNHIPNAEIHVSWTVSHVSDVSGDPVSRGVVMDKMVPAFFSSNNRFKSSQSVDTESGELSLTTDVTGKAHVQLFKIASLLSKPLQQGDSIALKATFLSPTKELLVKELTFPVSYSDLILNLRSSVDDRVVPKFLWSAYVSVDLLEPTSELYGKDVEVVVALFEWEPKKKVEVDETTGEVKTGSASLVHVRSFIT